MSISPAFINIFSSVLGLLFFAQGLSWALLKKNPSNETFKKVKTIIKGWWIIILFLMACFALAPFGLLAGFLAISAYAYFEFSKHSIFQKERWLFFVIILASSSLQYASLWLDNWRLFYAAPLIFILIAFPSLLIFMGVIAQLPLLFAHIVGTLLILHFVAYLPGLYFFSDGLVGESNALYVVFCIILLTEINDILQFICGKAFGRHKIVPLVSPNKTEAGFIGGLIGSSLLAAFLLPNFLPLTFSQSAVLGAIISVAGIFGDLSFSGIKRYFDTKDFSQALPGHGGVLDRLDSLIFTAPSAFYYLHFLIGV